MDTETNAFQRIWNYAINHKRNYVKPVSQMGSGKKGAPFLFFFLKRNEKEDRSATWLNKQKNKESRQFNNSRRFATHHHGDSSEFRERTAQASGGLPWTGADTRAFGGAEDEAIAVMEPLLPDGPGVRTG